VNIGKTLFAQLMDFLPWSTFARIVARYGGDARVRTLCCAEQYRAMAFAQLTYRESLRDIEVCLSAQASKLYHMGFREPVRRSTLADANETRDWRICFPKRAPSMSWIAATSTSCAFMSCIRLAPSSLPAPSRTWMPTASTPRRPIGRPASLPTSDFRRVVLTLAHARPSLILWTAIFLPIAFIMINGSTLYDGARHVLFIIPLLAVIAGHGFVHLLPVVARVPSLMAAAIGAYLGRSE